MSKKVAQSALRYLFLHTSRLRSRITIINVLYKLRSEAENHKGG